MSKDPKDVLRSLLDRPDISKEDKDAIRLLLDTPLAKAPETKFVTQLNLDALTRQTTPASELRLCIDFGTAMSKAWATGRDANQTLPLLLGKAAGNEGLTVPSSVFIADDGRIFLGKDAETQQRATLQLGRRRFDNLKRLLSEAVVGTELQNRALHDGIDPTNSGLKAGDVLLLYLAWLTDLSETALGDAVAATKGRVGGKQFDPRGVSRRFAIPCFESTDGDNGRERAVWAQKIMSESLTRAQLLADTLHGRWKKLNVSEVLPLIRAIYDLDAQKLPHLIMDKGAVREPIAAGASRFDSTIGEAEEPVTQPIRHYLLVVDAGAGTTDIALFQVIIPVGQTQAKYGLLSKSVRMCRIAGNEIDGILRPLILEACGVDETKHSAEDVAYAKDDLDSRIRDIKQTLFERGKISIDLRPHFSGGFDIAQLLSDPKMKSNGAELLELRRQIFEEAFANFDAAELAAAYGGRGISVHVLLTGGSAAVPIIANLASGQINRDGFIIRFSKLDSMPEWINRLPREAAQMIGQVYPQCAVAIGGSAPTLPFELQDMEIPVTPPKKGTRKLGRFQVTGT